jgi:hydroxymethylbilane synthase
MVILGTNPHTTNPTSANRSPLPMSKSSSPVPSGVASSQNVATDASSPSRSTTFILGTRKSALALVQTQLVAEALRTLHSSPSYTFPIEAMSTVGDRNQTTPLHLLSPYSSTQPAKSLWTDELEARLIHGEMDVIVHSLKDVPTTLKDGCEIGCMLEREDPRDAFVVREGLEYQRLEDLPDGSVVGTGSVRRVAQLRRAFPKLKFDDMVSCRLLL